MFRHVSQSGKTLGNISEKHRETSNVSEVGREHFCFPGSKFCFRNNVSTGGQTCRETFEETSRITNVSATMFPSLPRALIELKNILYILVLFIQKFIEFNHNSL
jgi:hypothetical protein